MPLLLYFFITKTHTLTCITEPPIQYSTIGTIRGLYAIHYYFFLNGFIPDLHNGAEWDHDSRTKRRAHREDANTP